MTKWCQLFSDSCAQIVSISEKRPCRIHRCPTDTNDPLGDVKIILHISPLISPNRDANPHERVSHAFGYISQTYTRNIKKHIQILNVVKTTLITALCEYLVTIWWNALVFHLHSIINVHCWAPNKFLSLHLKWDVTETWLTMGWP